MTPLRASAPTRGETTLPILNPELRRQSCCGYGDWFAHDAPPPASATTTVSDTTDWHAWSPKTPAWVAEHCALDNGGYVTYGEPRYDAEPPAPTAAATRLTKRARWELERIVKAEDNGDFIKWAFGRGTPAVYKSLEKRGLMVDTPTGYKATPAGRAALRGHDER